MNKYGKITSTQIIIVVAIAIGLFFYTGGDLASIGGGSSGATGGTGDIVVNAYDGTTVKFSSWDHYAQATDAGANHKLVLFNGQIGIDKADDATSEATVGDKYTILLGKDTSGLSAAEYYPLLKTGVVPNKATYTISGGQYKVAGTSQVTATYWNEDGTANGNVSMGASDIATIEMRLKVSDNYCFGNPGAAEPASLTAGKNLACFQYNSTVVKDVELIGQTKVGAPASITAVSGELVQCYTFPIICDNDKFEGDLLIESQTVEPTFDLINKIDVILVDYSIDFDADNFELMTGYEDEDLNDIGIADFDQDDIFLN